jgi:hypothetical protein
MDSEEAVKAEVKVLYGRIDPKFKAVVLNNVRGKSPQQMLEYLRGWLKYDEVPARR